MRAEPDLTGSGRGAGGQKASEAAEGDGARGLEFVLSLERGLAVLCAFGPGRERMTLTQVATLTGLSRGTARRFLLTLAELDFLSSDGKLFWLTPKVLRFSHGYLASFGRSEAARPHLQAVSDRFGESCSLAVLDGADVVYVVRVEARRVFSSRIDIGTRLPAHCTALGRVLLSGLEDGLLEAWLVRHPLTPWTERTVTDPGLFRQRIQEARRQRHAIIDGETEIGSRSIAVPVPDAAGRTVAALNIGASAARVSLAQMRREMLPALRAAAARIAALALPW
ncbi:IclR family transcriptional regulator domain-containing protein [Teichococcus rhizosphaerae]|uniref:IclR family transcriptional regulator domain-containing protein n=1 Tax=Teichococcus rhizosphaerae TaxID=1335062 RepID=UPI001FE68999|nr:IclR family transcriptional regulator C-terminal domain-containing protein [Pseudoroseomonas rhizosphaerae]